MLTASPRTLNESPVLTVVFSTRPLGAGVTISSATVTAENGPLDTAIKDSNPSSTLLGGPTINASPLTVLTASGSIVVPIKQAILQQVQSGLAGANYVYRFKATLSDGTVAEEDVLQLVVPYVPV